MMTAEQLKNSILQLALQGRLVEQNKTDEPAQELLERIRAEKKALIKAGKVPKDKKMEDVSEEEQLFDLPENWVWTRMGELFQHNTGKALNGSNKDGEVLTYITTSNLYWNRFELDNLKSMPFTESEIEKCTATKGDLLVCEGGDYGRAAIWNFDFDIRIQNHVHRLRAYLPVCTEYFYYVINFLKSTGLIKGKGIAIQGLSSGALHNLVVPLPPLEEQQRIVDKIHEVIPIWEKYGVASTKLNTLNASFPDQMKKSILQQAVQGKLIPQDPNDESASVLLEKIAEEKQKLSKEGKIKKQKALPAITEDEIPFDIPETWEWARLGEIGDTNIGLTYKPSDIVEEGTIVLRSGNIQAGKMDYADVVQVKGEIPDRAMINKGDILICARNGSRRLVGKSAIVDKDGMAFGAFMAKFHSSFLLNEYIQFYIESPLFRGSLDSVGTETINQITQSMLKNSLCPVPPLNEQKRIVDYLKYILPMVEKWKVR